ncbi:methyltransferase [Gordonia sp. ABSL1-1]|uniref:class I SAM-dependent methyltransferase n=1 Tax=Gordonia sp. ABSL1-1 TaxID=3053923 RepID=UPI002572DA01|nr:class I SAM-dependent methyltransferase [Gordonia sp. ABSL1-1]MDL9935129.1 methyltransferase [Gordonia sp. ABSL1-1]
MDMQALRRHPDIEGPGLVAADAADRLILDEATELITAAPDDSVVVIDDNYGALTLGAAGVGAVGIRTHQDVITGERALAANAGKLDMAGFRSLTLGPPTVVGARVVLMRLPRSLDRLAEVAALVAAHADPDVVVVAGGRIKHMTPQMNSVLADVFGRVDVSHARQKSRVLFARHPQRARAVDLLAAWPRQHRHDDLDLTVVAHGGVFAGTKVDIGTRLLLSTLDDALPNADSAIDLACGSGILASWLARRRPHLRVVATDRSAAAVASARATATVNGVAGRVRVTQADGTENVEAGAAELIVLNPPFHSDAALSAGIAHHLFEDAARALAPGGELWCVWNSPLRYRPELERTVGTTRQVARDPKFTVTASTRGD